MSKTKKIIKLFKKYSLNKNGLIFNINDISALNELIDCHYKLSIVTNGIENHPEYKYMNIVSNSIFNVRANKNQFDLVCFNSLLEYYNDKDIIKILKSAISAGEAVILDVPISKAFCGKYHNNIRYMKRGYWLSLFNKLDTVVIEELTYRVDILEKHKIFVIRKR
jgi:hypothetical protein